jgi:hypothetical protein
VLDEALKEPVILKALERVPAAGIDKEHDHILVALGPACPALWA